MIINQVPDSSDGVTLRNGDSLTASKCEQETTVIGEVQNSTVRLYNPGLLRGGYIQLGGGFTAQADHKRIHVVRANGGVTSDPSGNFWFSYRGVRFKPGDTSGGPINVEQMPRLPFWQVL